MFLLTLLYEIAVLFYKGALVHSTFPCWWRPSSCTNAFTPEVEDMPSSSLKHSVSSAKPLESERLKHKAALMGVF